VGNRPTRSCLRAKATVPVDDVAESKVRQLRDDIVRNRLFHGSPRTAGQAEGDECIRAVPMDRRAAQMKHSAISIGATCI
jgi:hypothetical protein